MRAALLMGVSLGTGAAACGGNTAGVGWARPAVTTRLPRSKTRPINKAAGTTWRPPRWDLGCSWVRAVVGFTCLLYGLRRLLVNYGWDVKYGGVARVYRTKGTNQGRRRLGGGGGSP